MRKHRRNPYPCETWGQWLARVTMLALIVLGWTAFATGLGFYAYWLTDTRLDVLDKILGLP